MKYFIYGLMALNIAYVQAEPAHHVDTRNAGKVSTLRERFETKLDYTQLCRDLDDQVRKIKAQYSVWVAENRRHMASDDNLTLHGF